MALDAGTRLGPYEISALIGAGGMGEVYKASDSRLHRTVAIKVLPPLWASDPAMRERFDTEAQAIASLTHPHICTLHDVGRETPSGVEGPAVDYLVMEYIEGQSLAQRLERGALPLDEALKVAIAIAEAMDKAHSEGIVHRDLKPANVMLTPSGPKLLDFGLAKLKMPAWTGPSPLPSHALAAQGAAGLTGARTRHTSPPSPRASATSPGMVIGTLPYMAPEQIEGAEADARTDIFAFGAILYEMVTGARAFEGKNRALLIAAIATLELEPLSASRPGVSAALDHVARRCLEKNPDDRWQTARDLARQLRWVAHGGVGAPPVATAGRSRGVSRLLAAGLALIAVMSVPAFLYWQAPEEAEAFQFRIPVAGLSDADIAISPDGETVALVARPNNQEPSALFVRPVRSPTFRRLGSTDSAAQPFWSPDSRTIAFVSNDRLKRVDASGGAPKDLGEAPGFAGGAWNRDNIILFGSARGLFRVSAEGGKPEAITTVEKPETGHFWPSFLPDGQRYLYLGWSAEAANRAVFVGRLGSKEKTRLMAADSSAAYAAPGYVLFHRGATLFAQPFDEGDLTLTGNPVHIADQLDFSAQNGRGHFDVSQNGVLLYFQGGRESGSGRAGRGQAVPNVVFGWRDRTGRTLGLVGEQGTYGDIDLSPDGKFVAITRQDSGPGTDIWLIDWQRAGVPTRLTLDPADDINPVWSPAGDRIAFTTYRKGNADVYIKNANNVGPETPLLDSAAHELVEDWSKDGKYIAYKLGRGVTEDIYVLPVSGNDKKPFPVVEGPFRKDEPQFSYDGKMLAYTSDETGGTFEVYVVSFPEKRQQLRVSAIGGGGQPRWRRDGRELYYRAPDDGIMAVEIKPGPPIEAGIPRRLFTAAPMISSRDPARHQMSVTPDGQRFLLRFANNTGVTSGQGGVSAIPFTVPPTGGAGAPAAGGQAFVSSGLTVIRNWRAAASATPVTQE